MGNSEIPPPADRRLKLVRLIDECDLEGLGAELERRWTAAADERSSLRDLAEYVNRQLLRVAMNRGGDATANRRV